VAKQSKLNKLVPFARHKNLTGAGSFGYYGIQRSEEILPDNMQPFMGVFFGAGPSGSHQDTWDSAFERSGGGTVAGAAAKRNRTATDSEGEENQHPPHHRQQSKIGNGRNRMQQQQPQREGSLSSPMSDISGTILSSTNTNREDATAHGGSGGGGGGGAGSGGSGSKTVTDSDSEM